MHRPGIEPGPPAWQASILPLNQRCQHNFKLTNSSMHHTVFRMQATTVCAVVAEWLRRLTRNEFPFGSVGSNPTNCENFGWISVRLHARVKYVLAYLVKADCNNQ